MAPAGGCAPPRGRGRQTGAGVFVGDVTALELVWGPAGQAVVLAGAGGALRVLAGAHSGAAAALLLEQRVLRPGTRLHGVRAYPLLGGSSGASSWSLLLFGERELRRATLQLEPLPSLQVSAPLGPFRTWVLDAAPCSQSAPRDAVPVVVGCNDNSVQFWRGEQLVARAVCSESCLLYSMSLLPHEGDAKNDVTVAAGTIFHDVLLWRTGSCLSEGLACDGTGTPLSCPPLARLRGHLGSIYRVLWVEDSCGRKGRRLVTASDDRSGRVWERRDSGRSCESIGLWECRCSAFGHAARVWDCAQVDVGEDGVQALVTASEDCSCRVWSLEGKELGCVSGHTGRGVWRVAAARGFVVSSGADAAVKLWDILQWVSPISGRVSSSHVVFALSADRPPVADESTAPTVSREVHTCREKPNKADDWVCCLGSGSSGTLYLGTHKGSVYRVSCTGPGEPETWETLHKSHRRAPFSFIHPIEKGQGGVLLGDLGGYATLVAQAASGWKAVEWEAHGGRAVLGVFGCVGPRLPVTSDRSGEVKCWQVRESTECTKIGRSPHGKIVTTMDFCPSRGLLVCGDKKGNIFAFDLNSTSSVEGVGHMQAILSVEKSHSHNAITMVKAEAHRIVSGGQDGCIFEHGLIASEVEEPVVLRPISRRKMQSMASVHYRVEVGGILLLGGFQGGDFVLWNDHDSCVVLRASCGGPTRPHALNVTSLSDFLFSFCKYNEVLIQRCKNECGVPACQTLTPSHHGKEIYDVCIVASSDGGFPMDIFTCSEDGSVKCLRVNGSDGCHSIHNFTGERIVGAAMRALSVHQLSEDAWFLVSAGAQEVLNAWRVNRNVTATRGDDGCMSVEWVGARVPHKSGRRQRKLKNSKTKHRCLCVRSASVDMAGKRVSLLVVSSSDASLSVLALSTDCVRTSWQVAADMCFHESPVLSISIRDIEGRTFVTSGATDGGIALWDISSALQGFGSGESAQQLRPLLALPQVHQSGVNALYLCQTPPVALPLGEKSVHLSVVSGGDDQAIHITICCLDLEHMLPDQAAPLACVVKRFSEARAHGSAVRGVWMDGDVLLSGGRDQRVRMWRLEGNSLSLRSEAMTDVGNMEAMGVVCIPQPRPEDSHLERRYCIVACGRGLQVMSCHRSEGFLH